MCVHTEHGVSFACTKDQLPQTGLKKSSDRKTANLSRHGEDISLFVSAFTFWKSNSLRHSKLLYLCQFHLWRVIVMVYLTNEKKIVDSTV